MQESMKPHTEIDATQYTFDDFVSLHFDHEFVGDVSKEWYCNSEVTFVPQQFCAYYIRLFREPEILVGRFSKSQLEEGFWGMISSRDWSVTQLLWESEIIFLEREECVRAMLDLFTRFFAKEPLDSSCFMWWDGICYDYHCNNRVRERGGEDSKMQDVMFETLSAILLLDAPHCQAAALHGLGHLHHPRTQALVDQYLTDHPSLTTEQKEYALAAAKFQVQ
jgi:hypothetical protein